MSSQKSFSIEVFPPKAPDAVAELRRIRAQLELLGPKYFSITYGAGGSTQQGTYDISLEILNEGFEPAPHITCIGATYGKVREQIAEYKRMGIHHIVALRGDLPSSYGEIGEFHYANELVEFIRKETGDWFRIDVAAYPDMHPQAPSLSEDIANFVRKVKAGADVAITQYFYNPDAYFRFVSDIRKAGVDIPVIAGVMPITNYTQLARFSDMCGAEIPLWIRRRLESYGSDLASLRAFGHDVVLDLCRKLLEGGADGLHFYSLNRAEATARLWRELGLKNS
ncbi:MAG: methylenetetrahydrofolate reductase [NAD(P)H] [Oxalobacter sp.]|nr:methylenetetrahydrofolate reductase [NAD(P)H] [Oxalobacter sp.]